MQQLNEKPTVIGTGMVFLVPYLVTSFIFFDLHVTEWSVWARLTFAVMIAISLMWYAGRLSLNREINRRIEAFKNGVDQVKDRISERLED